MAEVCISVETMVDHWWGLSSVLDFEGKFVNVPVSTTWRLGKNLMWQEAKEKHP